MVPIISGRGAFFDMVWHSERSLAIVELDELPCIFTQCPSATHGAAAETLDVRSSEASVTNHL